MMIVAGTAALRILGNKEKEERNEKQTIPRVVNYIERGNSYPYAVYAIHQNNNHHNAQ